MVNAGVVWHRVLQSWRTMENERAPNHVARFVIRIFVLLLQLSHVRVRASGLSFVTFGSHLGFKYVVHFVLVSHHVQRRTSKRVSGNLLFLHFPGYSFQVIGLSAWPRSTSVSTLISLNPPHTQICFVPMIWMYGLSFERFRSRLYLWESDKVRYGTCVKW